MRIFEHLCLKTTLLVGAALLLCSAAGASSATGLSASQAWIRWLPATLPVAGYVTFKNDTGKAVKLVSASSPAFKSIEFHRSMQTSQMMTGSMNGMPVVGNMVQMKRVKSVTVPAHGVFSFKPGSYHVMMWRKSKINVGDRLPITFKFANGATLTVQFVVKGSAG